MKHEHQKYDTHLHLFLQNYDIVFRSMKYGHQKHDTDTVVFRSIKYGHRKHDISAKL